jgi:hypothetical protein
MGERLNDVYNNPNNTDSDFIIRSLNTILPNNSTKQVYVQLTHFADLMDELIKTSPIIRPDVKYIVEHIHAIQTNNSFDEFKKLLSEIIEKDLNTYKYLYLICYCRTLFEIFYESKIRYTKPEYAIKHAFGNEPWNIFLEAYPKNEYVYLP